MTDWPFAPRSWRFDTACFAGMTDSGTSNPSRINDVYAKVSKFRLTRWEKEVNK